jgi:hypothetical protein
MPENFQTVSLGTWVNSVAGLDMHRGQLECAASAGVCAVFGANLHAGATVANGPGEDPTPGPLSVGAHPLGRWMTNRLVAQLRDD